MSKNDQHWWEAQCGEYALGTLRGAERDVFEKILLVDDDASTRVAYWELKLSMLEKHFPTRQVPAHVLPQLMKKIHAHEQQKREAGQTQASRATAHAELANDLTGTWTEDIESVLAAEVVYKSDTAQQQPHAEEQGFEELPEEVPEEVPEKVRARPAKPNRIWKPLALLASAATLLLAVLLLRQTTQAVDHWTIPESGSLSIVLDTKRQTLWLLTLPDNSGQVTIIALAPPALLPEQSHHLWVIKPDGAGVSSVGLLPREPGESRTIQLPLPISQAAMFAISLEPATGSPEPLPTGPVLFNADIQHLSRAAQ